MDAWPNWKGKCFPVGMWQWRKCYSPGAQARQAPGRKAVRSLSMKSPKPPHSCPRHWWILCVCCFMQLAGPLGCPTRPPGIPWKFPLQHPKADSFLVRVHGQCHTAAGISEDLLAVPAHSPRKVCVHQGCTFCGYFPFEVRLREVKLFAWYIFLCGNGQTPFSCFWLSLIEHAKLHIFAMYLPSL